MKKAVEILKNRIEDINQKIYSILRLPQDDLMSELYHNQVLELTQELKQNEDWLFEALNPSRTGRPRIHEPKVNKKEGRGRPKKEPLKPTDLKACTRCNSIKPASEFYKNKHLTIGVQGECKECRRELNAKAREDREKFNAYHSQWQKTHPEQQNLYKRNWYQNLKINDPERYEALKKKYVEERRIRDAVKKNKI